MNGEQLQIEGPGGEENKIPAIVQEKKHFVIPKETTDVFSDPVDENIVEIRPDGIIYYPGVFFRVKLNKVFGPGNWGLVNNGEPQIDKASNKVFYSARLVVYSSLGERVISHSIGEHTYYANNPMTSYATATESAKTDCLTRCCKDLGIASELWDPNFVREWISKHGVLAIVIKKKKGQTEFWYKRGTLLVENKGFDSEDRVIDFDVNNKLSEMEFDRQLKSIGTSLTEVKSRNASSPKEAQTFEQVKTEPVQRSPWEVADKTLTEKLKEINLSADIEDIKSIVSMIETAYLRVAEKAKEPGIIKAQVLDTIKIFREGNNLI
jgi:hypothetical protein